MWYFYIFLLNYKAWAFLPSPAKPNDLNISEQRCIPHQKQTSNLSLQLWPKICCESRSQSSARYSKSAASHWTKQFGFLIWGSWCHGIQVPLGSHGLCMKVRSTLAGPQSSHPTKKESTWFQVEDQRENGFNGDQQHTEIRVNSSLRLEIHHFHARISNIDEELNNGFCFASENYLDLRLQMLHPSFSTLPYGCFQK